MDKSRFTEEIIKRDRREQQRRAREAEYRLGIRNEGVGGALDSGTKAVPLTRRVKRAVAGYILGAQTRCYGLFFLIYGLFTLLLHFAEYYLKTETVDVLYPLLCGAVCSLVSIPMLISDEPLYKASAEDPITSFLLYDFFCFRHFQPKKDMTVLKKGITVPFAVLLSILGFFTDSCAVILILLALVFIPMALSAPEFPFLLSLILLPYFSLFQHATIPLAVLVGIALVSYIRKLCLGNRTFTQNGYDLLIIFFGAFYLISGIFNGGVASFTNALLLVLLMSGYTLASGLIVNRRIADSATGAISICSAPVSAYAVYQYFFTNLSDKWSDPVFSDVIRGRVTGTFHNPNVLAMFLIVAALFSLYHLREAKRLGERIALFLLFALHVFALVLTFSRGAYIAIFFTLATLVIMRYVRKPGVLLVIGAALPYLLLLVPSALIERVLSSLNLADSSISYRLSILRSSLRMFADRLLLGVGIGEETFRDAFFEYAEEATVAPHSHNLLLQIGCEAGVFALIAFVAILIIRAKNEAKLILITRKSTVRLCGVYSVAALGALLLFGITDYVWSTFSIFYLFWIVFGIGAAVSQIAKRERDDRVYYYGDEQSPESSIVDIRLH